MPKRLTEQHKKAISRGLLKASAEGRRPPPSEKAIEAGLKAISNLPKSEIYKRAKKAGKTMKGRPQRLDTVLGAKEDNIHAKIWELKSPEGKHYVVKNLNNFIRENPSLFDQADIIWDGCHCRASCGLHSLNQINKKTGQPLIHSWKGWTGYSK